MSILRNSRNDRRRRVIREAVAVEPALAAASVRKTQRRAVDSEDREDVATPRKDPGYSQSVRGTCQQRLVQLIPIRPWSVVAFFLASLTLWGMLVFAHHLVHVRQAAWSQGLPIAYLFHLRSSHGIAHWLCTQLWMLTGIMAIMVFQLRRHKLDDYRARYRIWILVAIAAWLSSLDASSSGLYLLGRTIDTWAQREVGYSGWSLVLATFATLIGLLGVRLCSELKASPSSLILWLAGLLAWGLSALFGTGLIKHEMSAATTDLVVGGAWLGGIGAVFLSAGLFLRHTYIHAQKRFIARARLAGDGTPWKLPSLPKRKSKTGEAELDSATGKKTRRRAADDRQETLDEAAERTERKGYGWWAAPFVLLAAPFAWLRWPSWKSDPNLGEDYSDVSAPHRRRDDGFHEPFGKKPGWFQKTANTSNSTEPETTDSRSDQVEPRKLQKAREENPEKRASFGNWIRSSTVVVGKVASMTKRKPKSDSGKNTASSSGANSNSGKLASPQTAKPSSSSSVQGGAATSNPQVKPKRSWSLLPSTPSFKKSKESPALNQSSSASGNSTGNPSSAGQNQAGSPKPEKAKKSWFGFLDGLKLKPPQESGGANTALAKPTRVATTSVANTPVNSSNPPSVPLPSSSGAVHRNQNGPSSNPSSNRGFDDSDQDDGSDNYAGLSRAERKRLRKQQNRRAA